MSLQMPVTEDTPPDMLSGAMDLNVILPNGSVIKMSVERSTPMMDLLVQITTAHKLSPGNHAIHAIGDRGILPYKPSTPIGALDTWTVNIVPKNLNKNGRYQSQSSIIKCITKPFEQTFRLQVHLPRNQLYVTRISPKTQLNNILKQICFEKNLDPNKYTLRKPDKLNEPLNLSKSLVEYKLQQLSLVLNTNRTLIGGLSSDDIMSRTPKKFSCDDSLSSGSLGGRSLSPTRSDESSDTPRRSLMVKVLPSRPVRKRRLAPKPPSQQRNAPEPTIISHSRNSSDSSGYHESSVLSDAVDCSVGITRPEKFTSTKTSGPSISRSMTNLQACGQKQNQFSEIPFMSNNIGQSKHSVSTTSLISIQSRKKKSAPLPPLANKPKLAPPQEEPEYEQETQRKSQTLPVTTKTFITEAKEKSKTVSRIEMNNNVVEPNLSPATSSLSSLSRSDVDRDLNEPTSPTSSIVVGCKYLSKLELKSKRPAPKPPVRSSTIKRPEASNQPTNLTIVPRLSSGSTADEDELRMDDDEIDRIFGDATSGYDTPSIVTVKENHTDVPDIDWEYKLPDPPSAFRDDDHSPTVTMFDTVTIGNLKDVVLQEEPNVNSSSEVKEDCITVEESVKKIIGDEYHCFPQDSGVGSDDSSLPSSCEEKIHSEEKPVKIVDPKESKLNNFKIVAYDEDCSRPKEIFCDESVKTWKTTQIARESNPAYKSYTSNLVNRHKSFSTDRTNFSITVKRSTSHISLLSGNIKPSNRLAKHYIGRTYSTERLNYDEDSIVKRSFSVDNITEDAQESSQDCEQEIIPKKIEPTLEQSSPLHSLQILKTILPQIEDHKTKENCENKNSSFDDVSGAPSTLETESAKTCDGNQLGENAFQTYASEPILDAIEHKNLSSQTPLTVTYRQDDHKTTAATELPVRSAESENSHHEAPSKSNPQHEPLAGDRPDGSRALPSANDKSKRYLYTGPPKISLSTWNERPKRQVSIKTDRDYVIGIRQRFQQKAEDAETKPDDGPVSRVPIVKSVELKKPYAEQLQATSPVLALSEAIKAQAKLSNGYGYRSGTIALTGGSDENAKPPAKKDYGSRPYAFSKLMNRPRKPREFSANVDPRETLLESIRSFGGRDNLRKIRA
ncbi:cordon-bleu protein-like 1 isoform X3 [Sipha flava]|nr:cordon-bleu protein-like 1 isoform X3 [Sipha flava]XP_025413125.1 cordon-bleu protein-like 1 isoform X3 [Sipha flava]XP_025413131.1 cordon-bleu protein-like 1 isoform X3 [Sipha flava]XP_025413138.1 cordon-bleu protein-like 1 isoform X3 [Sipha flava]XP_025413144.1 cordon-bleu protein-like 1 isoform X3 [Sipha flava]